MDFNKCIVVCFPMQYHTEMQETPVWFLDQKFPWRKDRLPTPVFLGFPGDSDGKESVCDVGDLGLIPGLGRSPSEGTGYWYSCLENPMDCIVLGVTNSLLSLSLFTHYRIWGWWICRCGTADTQRQLYSYALIFSCGEGSQFTQTLCCSRVNCISKDR